MPTESTVAEFLGPDPLVGNLALESLVKEGESSLDSIISRFGTIRRKRQISTRLGRLFSQFGEYSLRKLIPVLSSGNWHQMIDATYCFDGLPAHLADDGIESLLDHHSIDVVRCAMDALGYLGAGQWRFKIKNIATSGSYNWEKLSFNALGAFMRMAAKETEASNAHHALWWIDDLNNHFGGTLIKSNRWHVDMVMVPEFTPVLADTLINEWAASKDELLRELAATALGWLRLQRSVPILRNRLIDQSESLSVRRDCAAALASIDSPESSDALRDCFQSLTDRDSTGPLESTIRLHLSQILWRIEDSKFVSDSKSVLLSDSNAETRAHTLYSLGLLKQAEEEIRAALSSSEYIVRGAAALGLARFRGIDSLTTLQAVHRESSHPIEQLLTMSALTLAGEADKAEELHRFMCEWSYSNDPLWLRLPWKREILLALDSNVKMRSHAQVWSVEMRVDIHSCYKALSNLVKSIPQKIQSLLPSVSQTVRDHAVVLIHGIRTQAEWQQRVAKALEDQDHSIRVIPTRYEFFDVIRFFLPLSSLRRRPIDRIARLLRDTRMQPNVSKISVIAHSYGTYIIGKILEDHQDIRFHRLILCGGILEDDFRWERYADRVAPGDNLDWQVINDCGMRDIWPVFAKSGSWGYGSSGRFGFGHGRVKDRFHPGGHSEFFSADFAIKYWLPYLSTSKVVDGELDRATNPWWLSVITVFPIKYMLIAAIVITLGQLIISYR